ncbi:protein ABHD11 [Crotalus adamanteus]|uniref:Protein ABHD11 n=1 Tax=Crotalus adamanteus TaxID=8729 RepID=A0AAW1CD13_CROAD
MEHRGMPSFLSRSSAEEEKVSKAHGAVQAASGGCFGVTVKERSCWLRPQSRAGIERRQPLLASGPGSLNIQATLHYARPMMLRALGFPRSPFRWARAQTLRCRLAITARERKGLASRAIVPVPLSYAIFDGPSSDPPLVFLHGLFGSKSNFSSLVKKLVLQTGRKIGANNRCPQPWG